MLKLALILNALINDSNTMQKCLLTKAKEIFNNMWCTNCKPISINDRNVITKCKRAFTFKPPFAVYFNMVIKTSIIIEHIDKYAYLGYNIMLSKNNQIAEISRRIGMSWVVFGNLGYISKDKTQRKVQIS